MDESFERISLKSTDTLLTENGLDSFKVLSGSVSVFVAWVRGNENYGRRVMLTEVSEGDYIPGFSAYDHDENGEKIRWCFLLEARSGAEIQALRGMGTSVTQRRFIRRVEQLSGELNGIGHGIAEYFENEDRMFDRAVIEYYQREELKAAAFISKGEKKAVVDTKEANHIFAHIFDNDVTVTGDDPVYRAVAYACAKSHISCKDLDSIVTACGKEITVPNIAVASQFACRNVVLEPAWNKKDSGTIVGTMDGVPVSCIPQSYGKYMLYNGDTEETVLLSDEDAARIDPKAFVISRTLPSHALAKKDLVNFGKKSIRRSDLITVLILGLAAALIGILVPTLNQKIYDDYIPLGNEGQLVQICVVIASFMLSSFFFDMVKNLSNYRISSHIGYDLQNAMYYRVFQLPESFFRNYDSADLGQRLEYVSVFAERYVSTFIVSGLATVFSVVYLIKMFRYSGKLTWFAILMLLVYALIISLISVLTIRFNKQAEDNRGKASAKLYQFLSGIEKIRMAGAEDKAANEYLVPFAAQQNLELKRDKLTGLASMISGSVSTIFSMVFYLIIVKSKINISTGAFMAFNSAFGAFSGVILSTIRAGLDIYELRPLYERFRDLIETAPEDDGKGKIIDGLRGGVSVRNLYFSYDGSRNILNGINLEIKPGEYVGIVGASGCGKSTLLKLMLGFESPNQGNILYDESDLKTLDKKAFRKNLGVVLQNGKLIAGSIYENITITAPRATMKDVNRVIEAVGLKEDIDNMPMGIRTVLSENSGTISGGQQQRILIARAIISDPSILIFDEATSALDNRTQAEVCRSLEAMKITRITVAHRLSTIQNCDRIFVLDKGVVAEEGNYQSLMDKHGLFYQLAQRQIS